MPTQGQCKHIMTDGRRCLLHKSHRGRHMISTRRPLVEKSRVHPLSQVASDAHILVDRALEQGRAFLYVDGKGRIRDVRHDADVSALPPRPPDSPARRQQLQNVPPASETRGTKSPTFQYEMLTPEKLEPKLEPYEPEKIHHPSHYGGDTTYEAIKVIEAWKLEFCTGNAVKYICRAGRKSESSFVDDLRKAIWYLNRRIVELGELPS
jgi:hypothetical protein